jgi:hypothetical protein
MVYGIKQVEYYNIAVEGHVGEGSKLLAELAGAGVDFLAYKAVPLEPGRTQFTLVADDGSKMNDGAKKAGLNVDGPHSALLIQGDERPGALADIYEKLSQAAVPVYESSGIAHINGGYGVLLYIEQDECDRALAALLA